MEVSRERPKIIEAEPEPLTVHCSETAVIVVDMQNDFCSKGGLFDRAGINISAVRKPSGRRGKCFPPLASPESKLFT